jgi:3'-5' exonuclease
VIVFDIETGPLPADQLPPFDRESVSAPSNWKDPEKIAKYKDEAEAAWREKLALSPLTGRVVALGLLDTEEPGGRVHVYGIGDGIANTEETVLQMFWAWFRDRRAVPIVGFNIFGFDLPFLYRRSLLLGVPVPHYAINPSGYWYESFVDLMRVWACGDRGLFVKLDTLCQAFGVQGKLEGVSGKDFAGLWESDPVKAIEYLTADVHATKALAEKMLT